MGKNFLLLCHQICSNFNLYQLLLILLGCSTEESLVLFCGTLCRLWALVSLVQTGQTLPLQPQTKCSPHSHPGEPLLSLLQRINASLVSEGQNETRAGKRGIIASLPPLAILLFISKDAAVLLCCWGSWLARVKLLLSPARHETCSLPSPL